MKDYLVSLFIDDELDLDEKIEFVETVHRDAALKEEAVALLNQEKQLRHDLVVKMPPMPALDERQRWRSLLGGFGAPWWRSLIPPLAAALMLVVVVTTVWGPNPKPPSSVPMPFRFILFNPTAHQIQLVGSFTHWVPVQMQPTGESGYWSLTVSLPVGEHRYSYLTEDGRQMADPTIPLREKDDFGGENSIIRIEETV